MIEEIDEVNVAVEIGGLMAELHQYPAVTARPLFQLHRGRARRVPSASLLRLSKSG